jgi:hypothetical protein
MQLIKLELHFRPSFPLPGNVEDLGKNFCIVKFLFTPPPEYDHPP